MGGALVQVFVAVHQLVDSRHLRDLHRLTAQDSGLKEFKPA